MVKTRSLINTIQIIITITLVFLVFCSSLYAENLSFFQRLKYRVVSVMDPTGQETLVLVNRFTDEAEYSWTVNGWMKAPSYIKYCYKHQNNIRSMVRRWRVPKRQKTK